MSEIDLRPVEIRATRRGLFHFLIPVLVTGIQPDQVLGLNELFPRRCWIPVTSTRDEERGDVAVLRYVSYSAARLMRRAGKVCAVFRPDPASQPLESITFMISGRPDLKSS
ncbi:hypothetical protein CN070_20855 [Sinorhizobium meliloti]|nr:hypothetical protein CN070_20855 [Sinorhizobium meliloti]